MSNGFVPFNLGTPDTSSGANSFRLKSIPPSSSPSSPMSSPAKTASPSVHPTTPCSNGEVKVSLQKEGDRITGIRIQCSCGQIIELACVY